MAGGLNLYGYAGGDPVNFSDPFGLYKVDLSGLSTEQRQQIAALRRSSATFDGWYRAVDADARTFTVRNPVNATERELTGELGGGFFAGTLMLLSAPGDSRDGQMEFESVVAHEFAHAAAGLRRGTPQACYGTATQEQCATSEANTVHKEIGYRERTDYSADKGPFKQKP